MPIFFDKGYAGLSADTYDSRYGVVAEPDVTIRMKRDHIGFAGEVRVDGAASSAQVKKPSPEQIRAEITPARAPAAGPVEALPLPSKPSIAVLPFQNMSGDPQQEYFADGLTGDIITGLSQQQWFFVIASNSSFAYKGEAGDVRQIAGQLGVRYILEGSVRRSANRVRVTGQLIDATLGNYLWAERYDRLLDDIFAVQDEITANVIAAIEPSLRRVEIERVKRNRPDNLDAYDLVLRALAFTRSAMVVVLGGDCDSAR